MSDFPKGDTSWFVHDRFGMFIHWGIYSTAARHEWVKQYEQIPDEVYRKYFDHFDPDLYDPRVWAEEARNAGMKYFVITSKHHDGFCLWDSYLTDYKAPNTPARRDLLTPMVDAFRAEGLKVGFYHSLIDWHHPEFTVDGLHPMRNNEEFREANKGRDMSKYVEYLHGQARELLTRFGRVDIMWFDFSYPHADYGWSKGKGHEDWQSEKLVRMIRELQPHVILDDRLDLPDAWDVKTPEQYQPREWLKVDGKPVVWEACQTFSGSWGYYRDEYSWREPDELIRTLIDCVSKGGNLLLNVGPNARGEIDPRAIERLRVIGDWMRLHGRSIYGCTESEFAAPQDARFTQNGKRLYLHLFAWPYKHVHLDGLAGKVEYAQLLNDASEAKLIEVDPNAQAQNMTMQGKEGMLTIELPQKKPNVAVPVVELFLR